MKAATQGILSASAEQLPVLHAVAQLCNGHAEIDLGNRPLRDQAALDAFFGMIKRNSSFTKLILNGSQLGEKAGMALADALRTNSSFKALRSCASAATSWARRGAWPWRRG